MQFDRHTVVLLVRPPDPPDLSHQELDAQDAHLAARQGMLGAEPGCKRSSSHNLSSNHPGLARGTAQPTTPMSTHGERHGASSATATFGQPYASEARCGHHDPW